MAKKRFNSDEGPSQRQLRVGELIRRTLADVLNRGDIHDPDLNRMSITVGEVRTSSDLKVATAFVLPLGGQGRDEALQALRNNRHELRHQVAKHLTLKFAPELRFLIDETFDRMDDTRRLLEQDAVRRDLRAQERQDEASDGAEDPDLRDDAALDGLGADGDSPDGAPQGRDQDKE